MNKELDPLRELEAAEEREELSPTQELRAEAPPPAEPPAPRAPAERPNRASTPSSRLPAVQSYPSSSTRLRYGSQHQVSIRENIVPREHIRLYANLGPIITLFTLGIIVAFLAIGIVRSASVSYSNPTPNAPSAPVAATIAPPDPAGYYPETAAFVDPLFGQYAVKRCVDRCDVRTGAAREACSRGCNMYQLHIYGRRVGFERYDPATDVTEISDRCGRREIQLEEHTSGSLWLQDIGSALALLEGSGEVARSSDVARLRAHYHKLLEAASRMRLPPGGTAMEISLAKDTVRATCFQANLALTGIALTSVQQGGDETSARYYRQILQGLEPKAAEASMRVLNMSKSLKLR